MQFSAIQKTSIILWGVFILAFILGPVRQLHGLELIPGDFGDARLNNYFLENIYQYLIGKSPSLIHLNFFSFFPYVLGFSDNLFGAAPIYLFFRAITGESDTAFQFWMYGSYVANYFAAYWGLRLLGIKPIAAIFGAFIFTFALPVFAKTLHAQLGYRFCVPLVIAYLYLFLESGNIRLFLYSMAWLVWGFYCSIYIGVFTIVFIIPMGLVFLLINFYQKNNILSTYFSRWRELPASILITYASSVLLLALAMLLLMYPYIEVSKIYGFKRTYAEISSMLPSVRSYFFADLSPIWSPYSKMLLDIPMRYEQQAFIGIIPLVLFFASFFISKDQQKLSFCIIGGALLVVMACTFKVGEFSLWEYFSKLPLLNSMRAVSRIILVLLFPIAFLCSLSIQRLAESKNVISKVLIFLLFIGVIGESISSNNYAAFTKAEWRSRLQNAELRLPKDLPPNAILFFAQKADAPHIAELDAMWVSMNQVKPTLNGYSGNFPPGYLYEFGSDCSEMPRRVMSYLSFTKQLNTASYSELMHRVVPIGFDNCQLEWRDSYAKIPFSNEPYTEEAFKRLSIQSINAKAQSNHWSISLDIFNGGDNLIAANPRSGNHIRLSYRLLDQNGDPISNWDPRLPLLSDIPAKGRVQITFDIPKTSPRPTFVEFSLVQEGIFWAHDLGIAPKKTSLDTRQAVKTGS